MRTTSGPIRVFGDDTFIVEFVDGVPLAFTLTVFEQDPRKGAYDNVNEEATFDDGPKAVSTDLRALKHAYRIWTTPEELSATASLV